VKALLAKGPVCDSIIAWLAGSMVARRSVRAVVWMAAVAWCLPSSAVRNALAASIAAWIARGVWPADLGNFTRAEALLRTRTRNVWLLWVEIKVHRQPSFNQCAIQLTPRTFKAFSSTTIFGGILAIRTWSRWIPRYQPC
jgi:hypothetical protein